MDARHRKENIGRLYVVAQDRDISPLYKEAADDLQLLSQALQAIVNEYGRRGGPDDLLLSPERQPKPIQEAITVLGKGYFAYAKPNESEGVEPFTTAADRVAALEKEVTTWRDCFAEITAKVTPYGNEGYVTAYIIPAGPIHRTAGRTGFQFFGGEEAVKQWRIRAEKLSEALIKAREIIKDNTPIYHHPECWPDPDEYSWIDAVLNEHPGA